MDKDITLTKKELVQIAANFPTDNSVRKHRYVRLLYEDAEFVMFGKCSALLFNHVFPATIWLLPLEEQHKAELTQYNEYLGVES